MIPQATCIRGKRQAVVTKNRAPRDGSIGEQLRFQGVAAMFPFFFPGAENRLTRAEEILIAHAHRRLHVRTTVPKKTISQPAERRSRRSGYGCVLDGRIRAGDIIKATELMGRFRAKEIKIV